jgi:hypothetical protein
MVPLFVYDADKYIRVSACRTALIVWLLTKTSIHVGLILPLHG